MPTYVLEPVSGGSNIELPDGETLIGRGPSFGISDKRVSRNHAVLDVSNDGLRIKPTHINPCFYQPSGKEHQVLERDKWYPLHKGDIFSLLPDKYIFRVISTDSDSDTDATLSNSQMLDEQLLDEEPAPSSSAAQTVDKSPSCSSVSGRDKKTILPDQRNANSDRNLSNKTSHPFEKEINDMEDQQKLPPRKRVLPAWMLQGHLENQSPSKSRTKAEGAGRGKTKGNAEPSKPGSSQQRRRQLSSSDSGEEDMEIKQQMKKKSRTSTNKAKDSALMSEEKEADVVEGKDKSVFQKQKENETSESEGKGQFLLKSKEPEGKKAVGKPQPDEKSNWQLSDNEEADTAPTVSHQVQQNNSLQSNTSQRETPLKVDHSQKANSIVSEPSQHADDAQAKGACKRLPCIYAERCYRKNLMHFKEFSHPGDEDYNSSIQAADVSESDDDRPECPYGTACYRKNPQHKMEYKHTENPDDTKKTPKQKATNKRKSVLDGESDDEGEPNEYDLNDSFIDDEDYGEDHDEEEEEEFDHSDEDSDWQPDSEDVDVLVKEATEFVKSKH